MVSYIIWAAVIVLVAVILLLPVGVDAGYGEAGAHLRVKAGPAAITILPAKPKKDGDGKKKKKKEKKPKKEKEKPGRDFIFSLIELGLRALGRFRRRLCIQQILLHYTVSCDDPYDTVMRYTKLTASVNALWPRLERIFDIRRRDICFGFSFTGEAPKPEARLVLTIRIGQILAIGILFGAGYLRLKWNTNRAKRAEERKQNDGQHDDRKSGRDDHGENQGNGGRKHGRWRAHHHA